MPAREEEVGDFCVVEPSGDQTEGAPLTRLGRLILAVITSGDAGRAGLTLRFDERAELRICGEANATTAGDFWWLGRAP